MDPLSIKEFGAQINALIQGRPMSEAQSFAMFRAVMCDEQPDLQQGAFLAALAAKGETVEELVGAWRAIDAYDTVHGTAAFSDPLFENSGTGMDQIKTFNVSSAAAIVAAACGVRMARHGSRAITSTCGTVDILEAVGIRADCDVPAVETSIRLAGIGLFNGMSPKVHPGGLARVLRQIRFGSTLNIAASLAHPCRPTIGLRGVHTESVMNLVAETMQRAGYTRGMVVFGRDEETGQGMDELSVSGETLAVEFSLGNTRRYAFAPEDVGLKRSRSADIASCGNLADETARFLRVLSGRGDPACADFTCLNAAAILYTAGKCADMKQGCAVCRETIESGRAAAKLGEWIAVQGTAA